MEHYKTLLPWLLEETSPGIRYLAMRDLQKLSLDDPQLLSARAAAHKYGPIADVLSNMNPQGWWEERGPGYNPKYRSTAWSVILLAQLGACCMEDTRISMACRHLLDNAYCSGGQISMSNAPSATIDCLQGNVLWALTEMGYDDSRIEKAYEWMARTVTGEGIAPRTESKAPVRYYAGKSGPNFECGANNYNPCAWGAVKVLMAFSNLPEEKRSPLINQAISHGVEFLLSNKPDQAGYPNGFMDHPSRNWWKFGFPVFYITDILQIAEVMAYLGYLKDPRLAKTIELIQSKQLPGSGWALEYDYAGKTWGDYGDKNQPNKWVSLRALRVLTSLECE